MVTWMHPTEPNRGEESSKYIVYLGLIVREWLMQLPHRIIRERRSIGHNSDM